nr:hypothetical protein [Tanacetum cinerariifolium]
MVKSSKLRRLRKVGASRRVESSIDMEDVFNQERMIDDMDNDEGIELVKDADEDDLEVQEVVEVVTTAKLITEVATAAASQNTAGYKMDLFKGMTYAEIFPIFQARFDENIRFLFKSREEMEEED